MFLALKYISSILFSSVFTPSPSKECAIALVGKIIYLKGNGDVNYKGRCTMEILRRLQHIHFYFHRIFFKSYGNGNQLCYTQKYKRN